jgi:predicted O-linked N-acetylglucosamine transferase (SPINDLY family)
LLTLLHTSGDNPELIRAEHARWAERHAGPLYASAGFGDAREDSSDRPLRIGYVSPDFHRHPVARFFEPLLAHRDHGAFHVTCYSDVPRPDAVTARLRGLADEWRDVAGASDAAVAERIRSDRIDILVDLAGHTGGNRLLVFAGRAAPVQISYIGYPHSTGLTEMDYKVTDEYLDPPGMTEHLYTEKLVRLPGGCWCYRPGEDAPDVNALPALNAGHFTFASLNRPMKLTPGALRLWAEILRRVPNARLLAVAGRGCEQDPGLRQLFKEHGIDPARLVLAGRRSRLDYFRLMQEVDVALDTFPHAGHTTTCDAMWMGVPTVTLAGRTHVSRLGAGVLSAVGLDRLVAATPEEYVERAVALASDLPKLAELRAGLRERMDRSPLCDGPRVARALEQAYRGMGAAGCAEK